MMCQILRGAGTDREIACENEATLLYTNGVYAEVPVCRICATILLGREKNFPVEIKRIGA